MYLYVYDKHKRNKWTNNDLCAYIFVPDWSNYIIITNESHLSISQNLSFSRNVMVWPTKTQNQDTKQTNKQGGKQILICFGHGSIW